MFVVYVCVQWLPSPKIYFRGKPCFQILGYIYWGSGTNTGSPLKTIHRWKRTCHNIPSHERKVRDIPGPRSHPDRQKFYVWLNSVRIRTANFRGYQSYNRISLFRHIDINNGAFQIVPWICSLHRCRNITHIHDWKTPELPSLDNRNRYCTWSFRNLSIHIKLPS